MTKIGTKASRLPQSYGSVFTPALHALIQELGLGSIALPTNTVWSHRPNSLGEPQSSVLAGRPTLAMTFRVAH